MKIFYDTEFVEDGLTIEPLSIGMIREDGETLYCVNNSESLAARACSLEWVYENVMTQLPYTLVYNPEYRSVVPLPDVAHPDFLAFANIGEIAEKVEDFVANTPSPELWADYAAYDHVLLAQLFGPMVELPSEIPMWTHDFRQMLELGTKVPHLHLREKDIPAYVGSPNVKPHNALYDACKLRHDFLWLRDAFPPVLRKAFL